MINNILAVWAQATPKERQEGETWYPRAHAVCDHLSLAHYRPLDVVVGVVAILSPRNRWERNLIDAAELLTHGERAKVTTFGAQRAKALALLGAQILSTEETRAYVGKGLKTLSFFDNLLDPWGSTAVTIDGHAANIAAGRRRPLDQTVVTPREYERLAEEYRRAARLAHTTPITLQATTWLTWRRIHGI